MPTRIKTIWYHILLPLTAWLYLPLALVGGTVASKVALLGLVFAASVLTAIAGYLTNDFFDRMEDRIAGKQNFFNHYGRAGHLMALLILAATVFSWYHLHPSPIVLWLLLAEALLLLSYSLPGLRLKRNFGGILADALYSRVVPAVVLLLLIVGHLAFFSPYFWATLVGWLFISGIRNILLHQVDDRKKDRVSGNGNVVLLIGAKKTVNFILRVLLPIELILLSLWGIAIWHILPGAPIIFVTILLAVALCYMQWERRPHTKNWWQYKLRYLPNHLYEEWLPIIALALLALSNPWFWLLMALHLLMFYKLWPKYARAIRLVTSRAVNYLLFYLFKLGGVDLKKEHRSALQHLSQLFGKKSR